MILSLSFGEWFGLFVRVVLSECSTSTLLRSQLTVRDPFLSQLPQVRDTPEHKTVR